MQTIFRIADNHFFYKQRNKLGSECFGRDRWTAQWNRWTAQRDQKSSSIQPIFMYVNFVKKEKKEIISAVQKWNCCKINALETYEVWFALSV